MNIQFLKKEMVNKKTYIFLAIAEVFIFTLLFLGGLGYFASAVEKAGMVIFGAVLILGFLLNKKFSFPQGSFLYVIFLVLLAINIYTKPTTQGENYGQEYLALFISGGLVWFFSYNFRDKIGHFLENSILALGVLFGALFVINKLTLNIGLGSTIQFSLFLPYTQWHNHIGDIWAICMVVLVARFGKGKKLLYLIPLLLGFYFLFESLSRSAYLALGGGVFYLFLKGRLKDNKIAWGVGILLGVLFIVTGYAKTTFFSRPYFLEAVLGIVKNPQGVGMGNFIHTTQSVSNEVFGENILSFFTHNIILEVLVGMGIWGISFILWILWASLGVLETKRTLLPLAIFFAIFINFFFDTTYFIPTMLWLWFFSLGLSQDENKITFKNTAGAVRGYLNQLKPK